MQMLVLAKPDAIFAASDAMAIGAIRATRELGIRVPEDIAFVGFDDLPIATLSNIQLTTVRQPVVEFGIRAVEALIDQIENNGKKPYRIIMETELVIRESSGAAIV
jgi:LacI family transcriptional regulator